MERVIKLISNCSWNFVPVTAFSKQLTDRRYLKGSSVWTMGKFKIYVGRGGSAWIVFPVGAGATETIIVFVVVCQKAFFLLLQRQ